MVYFFIRFLLCNLLICIITGILFVVRKLFRHSLTSRMQYHLWFLFLGILAVPFLPLRSSHFLQIFSWASVFSWIGKLKAFSASLTGKITSPAAVPASLAETAATASWMNDFSISVSRKTPSCISITLLLLWIAGIIVMVIFMLRSTFSLHALKKSALPLQNKEVRTLYGNCLSEMNIAKPIPIYSTAFLKSPAIVGLFKPCIYLPLHLISDYNAVDMRYMLLHELQHYKHKDALANYLMNFAVCLYWFNPFVWYAWREMRNDREIACDTSVLKMLTADAYADYGNTLLNFAQKVSLTPFPFISGIGGSMTQMQRRIINIANYHPLTSRKKLRCIASFGLIAILLSGFVPALSAQAVEPNRYVFYTADKNISCPDLSASFDGYDGSFVLYDTAADSWQIYHMDSALTRIAPASTYKIYIALSGLENGIITAEDSLLPWNGETYGFDSWNDDQTLESAMQNSVNWYFQTIDEQTGMPAIKDYVQKIGYGNQTARGDAVSYWTNSSLRISPVEQVEMLKKLYDNEWEFSPEAVETVKNSIRLSTSIDGAIYGKTGTENVNHRDISGWFIGFVEKDGHPCFFATNIQGEDNATGAIAAKLTLSILSDFNLWTQDIS